VPELPAPSRTPRCVTPRRRTGRPGRDDRRHQARPRPGARVQAPPNLCRRPVPAHLERGSMMGRRVPADPGPREPRAAHGPRSTSSRAHRAGGFTLRERLTIYPPYLREPGWTAVSGTSPRWPTPSPASAADGEPRGLSVRARPGLGVGQRRRRAGQPRSSHARAGTAVDRQPSRSREAGPRVAPESRRSGHGRSGFTWSGSAGTRRPSHRSPRPRMSWYGRRQGSRGLDACPRAEDEPGDGDRRGQVVQSASGVSRILVSGWRGSLHDDFWMPPYSRGPCGSRRSRPARSLASRRCRSRCRS